MQIKTPGSRTKGYVSFIALVLAIISSLFVFYFINLTNTNAIGVDVKHSLDRSTKAASACVDEETLSKGFFKIDPEKAKEMFEKLINMNLSTEDKIKLVPIKQHKGIDYVFQYNGYEDLKTKQSKLDKTPKITFFVFNAENDIVSDREEEVEAFISFIKSSLEQVQVGKSEVDGKIKDGIFSELTGKTMSGASTGVKGKVTDTRSFVLAIAEIPVNTFNGSLTTMYRFSTSRLNSKVDTVQENTNIVKTGLLGRYYEHAIEEVDGVLLPPSQTGKLLAERIDKTVNFDWGTYAPHPNVPSDGFTVEWLGLVCAPASGTITFRATSDEGTQLWVDNVLIIDKWRQQTATSWTGTITLTEGEWYPIKLRYYENTGPASVKLSWKYNGLSDFQIIPTQYLLPYTTNYSGEAPYYSKTFVVEEPTGIYRFKEIIEVPVVFDDDKMVKNVHNMTLLDGDRKVPFIMEDIEHKGDGSIKKGKLVFVDDLNPNEKKIYRLVFSEGIVYYPPDSGIRVTDDGQYITIKNNDLYTLKFRKASRAGYTQAYVNGSSYDAIGESSHRNFYFSNSNARVNDDGSNVYSDWASLSNFKVIEENAIYTKVLYEVPDTNNLLKYYLEAIYYKNSPIIKHEVYNQNISSEPLYSFYNAHAPMLERTSYMDGMEAWGITYDNQVESGSQYKKRADVYKATGVAYWSNYRNYHVGLHSIQGVTRARKSVEEAEIYHGGRMDISYDNDQQILKPGDTSNKVRFWMSVSHKDYLGDGEAVAQNITQRMANPIKLEISDTFSTLNKPDPPVIVPSKTGIIEPGEKVTFDIASYVDNEGNPVVDVQWEGRTPNDRYRAGMHTIKARIKNNLGVWSDWAEYHFSVKFTVLEVYPDEPDLQPVVDKYAPGQIEIVSMHINDFNNNEPNLNAYDMIVFGFADTYKGNDISDTMAQKLEKYIQDGKGVLFSHDTIHKVEKNFTKYFAKYLNLYVNEDGSYSGTYWWAVSPIHKTKEGKLTQYPYQLPDEIEILESHHQYHRTGADVWYAADLEDPQGTWFITSYQNVVYTATGHSGILADAPEYEQKLLINTIYYTSQFRQTEIIEEPTAKISAMGSSGITGVYYNGDTVSLSTYDEYLPNGNITRYEWEVVEKFGSQNTYKYSTSNPSFTINAPKGSRYEIRLRIHDELNVPSEWITKEIEVAG